MVLRVNDTTMADLETLESAKSVENKPITFPVPVDKRSRVAGKLRYWWCWFVAASLLLAVGAPDLLFTSLINKRTWLYPVALWGARTWLGACGAKVKVKGLHNLDPNANYVFVSNHRSYLDTATLFAFTGRRMGLVAKKELLKVPVLGQGMGFVNIIAIDRTDPERALASMEKARDVIKAGYSFGIFAEGTRAMPGQLLPFKKGAFHLALQVGVPIVPVAIKNTDVMMGKNSGVAHAGEVEMVLLPPITTSRRTAAEVSDLLMQARAEIMRELARG